MPLFRTSPRSDADLIAASRADDSSAYAELWSRHYNAGLAVARGATSTIDPEDLVQEAFTRVYQALLAGGGPRGAFRPYLFTTIRNTAASWGSARKDSAFDMLDSLEDPSSTEEASASALDHSLTARAFRSLPTRWQEVLWYGEVENMTPAQIAPLLNMKANAVAALSYRAREGLRQAWIQAHITEVPRDSACHWAISRVGKYSRGKLNGSELAAFNDHLVGCARCTIVAEEASQVSSRIAAVLLPITVGTGGSGAYLAWVQMAAPAAQAVAMPATVTGAAAAPAVVAAAGGATSALGGATGAGSGASASAAGGSASAAGGSASA
ncbi:MAG: sigma-70 family RNA polymerase sigma factor, partial [Mycetocola sp.]